MRLVLRLAAVVLALGATALEDGLVLAEVRPRPGPVLDEARRRLEAAGYAVVDVAPFTGGLFLGLERQGCRAEVAVVVPEGWDAALFAGLARPGARLFFDRAGTRTPDAQPALAPALDLALAKVETLIGRPRTVAPVVGLALSGPCPEPPPPLA